MCVDTRFKKPFARGHSQSRAKYPTFKCTLHGVTAIEARNAYVKSKTMEIGALLGLLIAASAAPLIQFIAKILDVLISFVCYREMVDASLRVRLLDDTLAKSGWTQRRLLEAGRLPGLGWHALWMNGPVFVHKTQTSIPNGGTKNHCELFIFGAAAHKTVTKLLMGETDRIWVTHVDAATIWRTDVNNVPTLITHAPRKWQTSVINVIMGQYEKHQHASVLIYGKAGIGKSEIALLLNKAMRKDGAIEPYTVISDPTNRGIIITDLVWQPPRINPRIILWNEYDRIVAQAENGDKAKPSDGFCIAQCRTTFLNILDRLNTMEHVVLIATMNAEPSQLPDEAYVRKGRFDLVIKAEEEV